MRLRSKHSQQSSPTDTPWFFGSGSRQLKSRSPHSYLTAKKPMSPVWPKAHRFHTCLMFRLKDRMKMEKSQSQAVEGELAQGEGSLRDLALKWFTNTQAPLILHEGNFPAWFQGFITRKDAEDHLRDKEVGCFLIRLSDKAVGYILSYKGRDRCRHFVINQNKTGQFIVTGDTEMHDSLTSLVAFYQKTPIEPFGEYLTCSCFESASDELYDVIQFNAKRSAGVSVQAVRSLWDQRSVGSSEGGTLPALPPKSSSEGETLPALPALPALPPKSSRRPQTTSQAVPPVPRRGIASKTVSLEDPSTRQERDRVLYARLEQPRATEREQPPPPSRRGSDRFPDGLNDVCRAATPHGARASADGVAVPGIVYTELSLMECRSRSLPLLDEAAESRSYRLSTPSPSPPSVSPGQPRRAGYTLSLQGPRDVDPRPAGRASPSNHGLGNLTGTQLYQLAGRPISSGISGVSGGGGSVGHRVAKADDTEQESDTPYAQVPHKPVPRRFLLDNTYEQIPEHKAQDWGEEQRTQGNTYESLEDLRSKQPNATSAAKSDKWRWLFPEHRKKQ